MVSELPPPNPKHEPTFGRGWASPARVPESRSEMIPEDPERLRGEREARRGLHPPQATIQRIR
jgi:hypothetical protein